VNPFVSPRVLRTVAGALVLAVAVGACGSDTDQALSASGSTTVSTTTTAPTTTEAPTTTAAPTTTTAPPVTTPLAPAPGGGAPLIHRIQTTDPVIFVTIDDGTHAEERALQYIVDTGMPVSLFLNDPPVRTHPEYFQRLIDLGNRAHSHTLNHVNVTKLDADGQRAEICGMADVLDTTYGDPGELFRAPLGISDETTQQVAAGCGMKAVVSWMGTIDDGVLSLQLPALRPGDIILTHFKPDLYDNLVTITQAADAAGLRIARLEDYL
jgi:peptidoglycan/xylan/chitin deacetylase (PgdA/CDA1 family)